MHAPSPSQQATIINNCATSISALFIKPLYCLLNLPQMIHDKHRLDAAERQIRRLILSPGPVEDPIRWQLEAVSLDDSPRYEALSYIWGDAKTRKEIVLDDEPFSLSTSFATALKNLRLPDHPRLFWIDTLSINQSDVEERNEQVQLMREAYASASPVLIWLGESDEESDEVFEMQPTVTCGAKLSDSAAQRLCWYLYFELNERPWFYRLWVDQVLVLTGPDPNVGCGNKWVSWNNLVKTWALVAWRQLRVAFRGYYYCHIDPDSCLPRPEGLQPASANLDDWNYVRFYVSCNNLGAIFVVQNNRICSEPRDRIHALIGMLPEAHRKI
jgi:Heterokaryon incompatibility protein (HET)